jgi:hypothetical protein
MNKRAQSTHLSQVSGFQVAAISEKEARIKIEFILKIEFFIKLPASTFTTLSTFKASTFRAQWITETVRDAARIKQA